MNIFCGRANSIDEWIGYGGEEEEENQNDCKFLASVTRKMKILLIKMLKAMSGSVRGRVRS